MPFVLLSEVIPGESPEIHEIHHPAPNVSAVYEVSPYEFGNWVGGRVLAFFPTKYLGTSMSKGFPLNSSVCVNGFDKTKFLQRSTSNAWNLWITALFYGFNGFYKRDAILVPVSNDSIVEVSKVFKTTFNQTLWAHYPNPFANYNKKMANVDELLIVCSRVCYIEIEHADNLQVDGSEAGETIPLRPLIMPERKVDFIVAYDSSGEYLINDFVNGTTFGQSEKVANNLGLPFPKVPDSSTFLNLGLNRYPVRHIRTVRLQDLLMWIRRHSSVAMHLLKHH